MSAVIAAVDRMKLPPQGDQTLRAIGRIGYELGEALADLIDNSIDAKANRVEVTFHRNDRGITRITIADDGRGMNFDQLRAGMCFAGRVEHDPEDLGTYGMGLKSASFSQCGTLTVISRQSGETVAARWSVESIGSDWTCEVLDQRQASAQLDKEGLRGTKNKSGTLVVWDRLARLGVGEGDHEFDQFMITMISRLEVELGTTFHRYIEGEDLTITLATKHEKKNLALPRRVRAFNPFGYNASGRSGYPKVFKTKLEGTGAIDLEAHIWPSSSIEPAFLLGTRKGVEAQGIYAYRNKRLIQKGGWNGVIRGGLDPDLALARVKVDLPPGGLEVNVQKSALQVTASFSQAVLGAKSGTKTFDTYLNDARASARAARRNARPVEPVPVVPGPGLPSSLRGPARRLLANRKPSREITFAWAKLPPDLLFQLEPSEDRVVLNRSYRSKVLAGAKASKADAVLFKTLLFMVLHDEFSRSRISKKQRARLDTFNALLLQALKRS
ncbi:ATP-binding protein [Sphingosinicella sp. LY1275]|uniref:ATP-binding protein n=1 Tax=Sphingosinicella sp. LY1275 TaxID=3095379 RepID=UPI002ADEA745|nr:ATP-binding protein [Sphingosinicella sp. LY1275]MEA1015144.1 ATP-binding protein [Sphingosinicella sp. LY1275]